MTCTKSLELFTTLFESFKQSEHLLVQAMRDTKEDSPHHREDSVFAHTVMVCGEMVDHWKSKSLTEGQRLTDQDRATYDQAMFIAAIAALFHDFGKPVVEETVHSEERGEYRRYFSHEQESSVIFRQVWHNEEIKVAILGEAVRGVNLNGYEYAAICLMIEHHLPYKYTQERAVGVTTALMKIGGPMFAIGFFNMLMSDAMGRVTDYAEIQGDATREWIGTVSSLSEYPPVSLDNVAYVLIGPQGSGKSTFRATLGDVPVFSMDQLRVDHYGNGKHDPESYRLAWAASCEDSSGFNTLMHRAVSRVTRSGSKVIVSDNMNLSRKSRKLFVKEAQRNGYTIVAVVFDHKHSLETLIDRNKERTDHTLPQSVIERCYKQLRFPTGDEADVIICL